MPQATASRPPSRRARGRRGHRTRAAKPSPSARRLPSGARVRGKGTRSGPCPFCGRRRAVFPAGDRTLQSCQSTGRSPALPDGPTHSCPPARSRVCSSPAQDGSGPSNDSPDRHLRLATHHLRQISPRPRRAPASVPRAAGPSAPASPHRGRSQDVLRPDQQARRRRTPSA